MTIATHQYMFLGDIWQAEVQDTLDEAGCNETCCLVSMQFDDMNHVLILRHNQASIAYPIVQVVQDQLLYVRRHILLYWIIEQHDWEFGDWGYRRLVRIWCEESLWRSHKAVI